MKLKYTIVNLVLLTIVAVSAQDELVCDNPMLTKEFNPDNYPTVGVLAKPVLGDDLPICKRLNNKLQCCDKSAWENLQTLYTTLKTKLVTDRQQKAQEMNKEFKKAQDQFKASGITKKQARYSSYKKVSQEQKQIKKLCAQKENSNSENRFLENQDVDQKVPAKAKNARNQKKLLDSKLNKQSFEKKLLGAAEKNPELKELGERFQKRQQNVDLGPISKQEMQGFVKEKKDILKGLRLRKDGAQKEITKPGTNLCCKAMTAQCLSCSQGLTLKQYCEENPEVQGCKKPQGRKEPVKVSPKKQFLSENKQEKFELKLVAAAQNNPALEPLVEQFQQTKQNGAPMTALEFMIFQEQMRAIVNLEKFKKMKQKRKGRNLETATQKDCKTLKAASVNLKQDLQKEEEKAKQVYADFNKKLVEQRKLLFSKQKQCMQTLLKVSSGMVCATCDADYKKFIKKQADGTYQLILQKALCQRLTKSCYDYIAQSEISGKYLVKNIKMIKLASQNTELGNKLDTYQKLIEAKQQSIATTEDSLQDADIENVEKEIAKIEEKINTLNDEDNVQKNLKLVVKKPESCKSIDDCPYICEQFIGVSGATKEAYSLSQLAVKDLNEVAEKITNLQPDVVPVAKIKSAKKGARILSETTSVQVVYSSDTNAYAPDSTDNIESFNTALEENPLPQSEQVALSSQSIKSSCMLSVILAISYFIN